MSLVSQFFGGTSSRKIPLKILVVGGGGGSGGILSWGLDGTAHPGANSGDYSGSGAGGGVGVINNYWIGPGAVCPITVGAAGAAGVGIGSTSLTQGGNGGTSTFQDPTGETFTLIGGGGGGGTWGNPLTSPRFSPSVKNGLLGGCGGGGGYTPAAGPDGRGDGENGSYFTRSTRSTNGATPTLTANDASIHVGIDIGYGTLYGFPAVTEPYPGPSAPANSTVSNFAGGSGGGYNVTADGGTPGNPLVDTFFTDNVLSNGLLNNITGILTSYASGGLAAGGNNCVRTPGIPGGPYPGGPVNPGPGVAKTAVANSGNGGVSVTNTIFTPGPNISFSYGGPGIAGAAGVVVVSYPSAFAASPSFPGASDISSQTPGYRTYQFTSPGSITLP